AGAGLYPRQRQDGGAGGGGSRQDGRRSSGAEGFCALRARRRHREAGIGLCRRGRGCGERRGLSFSAVAIQRRLLGVAFFVAIGGLSTPSLRAERGNPISQFAPISHRKPVDVRRGPKIYDAKKSVRVSYY